MRRAAPVRLAGSVLALVVLALVALTGWLSLRAEPRVRRVVPVPLLALGLAGVATALVHGGSATSLVVVFVVAPLVGTDLVLLLRPAAVDG